jgi:hypothetical protein
MYSGILSAQDFDGDSVYYTPIPKPGSAKKKRWHTTSQDTATVNQKFNYFFSTQIGSLIGCTDCANGKDVTSTISVLNGVAVGKKFRAGIGFGFDSYVGWQTLPAFASLSWDIFGSKDRDALFIQLNYGMSKAWRLKSYRGYGFKSDEGGRIISPQLGYRLKYHHLNLSLAAGFKLQRVFSYYEYPTWNWFNNEYQQGTSKSTIKQDMSRFMITMAVGWR